MYDLNRLRYTIRLGIDGVSISITTQRKPPDCADALATHTSMNKYALARERHSAQ
jgi:hypothetical protein